jgi:hypothetical protein
MEQYELDSHNKRLVELINQMSDFAANDKVGEWLDLTPEVAKICTLLYEETGDAKYRDMLLNVVSQIDSFLIRLINRCGIDKKESYNLLRLKLKNILKHI